jgi:hypothetical protein
MHTEKQGLNFLFSYMHKYDESMFLEEYVS